MELTLVSDTYLSAEQRKRINSTHRHIVTIIPEVTNAQSDGSGNGTSIDLTQSMEALFTDYFKSRNKGQEPNERLLSLFKEVLSED